GGWRAALRPPAPVARWIIAGTVFALALVTFVPLLAHQFDFVPLPPMHWLGGALAGLLSFVPLQLAIALGNRMVR
ncbi:MAG TPA: hypothetical protein VIO81_09890, partial [Methyloversatilis sp.]